MLAIIHGDRTTIITFITVVFCVHTDKCFQVWLLVYWNYLLSQIYSAFVNTQNYCKTKFWTEDVKYWISNCTTFAKLQFNSLMIKWKGHNRFIGMIVFACIIAKIIIALLAHRIIWRQELFDNGIWHSFISTSDYSCCCPSFMKPTFHMTQLLLFICGQD